MQRQIVHIYLLHIWLCLQAHVTAVIETGGREAARLSD